MYSESALTYISYILQRRCRAIQPQVRPDCVQHLRAPTAICHQRRDRLTNMEATLLPPAGTAADPYACLGTKNAKHVQDCLELYMNDRGIDFIAEGGFERFTDLKYLWLARNNLTELSNLDSNFRLHCLYLNNNRLTTLVDSSLTKLKNLEELHASDNQLADLHGHIDVLKKLRRLKRLDLNGNPLCQETKYRLHVIKHMPWLELLDLCAVTDDERLRARRVTRPTFSAAAPPPQLSTEERARAAEREGERAAKAARRAARALAPVKRRVLEKRILLRPHWAEDDRRRRGLVTRDKFEDILRVYRLWPERARDADALLGAYAEGDLIAYVRFCKDVEPRGHRGRDPVIRALLEAEANAAPCPAVSVCMQMALTKANGIQRRRAKEAHAAKLALLGQGPVVAEEGPTRSTVRPPSDVFTMFVYLDAADARPVTNTKGYSDGREGFSRRGRPPPVPSTRTIVL